MALTNDQMARASHIRTFLRQHARPSTVRALIEDCVAGEADQYWITMLRGVLAELIGETE